jgi:hypothetical protein
VTILGHSAANDLLNTERKTTIDIQRSILPMVRLSFSYFRLFILNNPGGVVHRVIILIESIEIQKNLLNSALRLRYCVL